MLNIEHDILVFVRDNPHCSWIDALNAFDPQSSCNATDALLRCLLEKRLIEAKPPISPRTRDPMVLLSLSYEGRRSLAEYEQQQQEDIQRKEEKRKDLRNTAMLATFSSAVGAAVGAIISALLTLFLSA